MRDKEGLRADWGCSGEAKNMYGETRGEAREQQRGVWHFIAYV